jgi:leucyl-tRNA synthetase
MLDESKTVAARHKTVKKVTEDIYRNNFNTAVAAMMEFVNELYKSGAAKDDLIALAKILKPFAPHLASEMLEKLDSDDVWPKWDNSLLVDETVEMIVQVNGKLRAKIQIPAEDAADKAKLENYALADEKIKSLTGDKEIVKTIVVPQNKLVNIVVK